MQTYEKRIKDTVLIVDDNPHLVMSLTRLLKHFNREILVAESGSEALNLLANHHVQLLITDYRMPGMNGLELIEQAQESHPHVIKMLLTGHGDYKLAKSLINSGSVYRYIDKPWEDDDLQSSVYEALEKFRLEELNRNLQESLELRNSELENLAAGLEFSVLNLKHELDQSVQNARIFEQLAEVGMSTTQIAHDIRNPLTVISNGLFLLKLKRDESSLDHNVEIMEKALEQVTTMVESIPAYVKQIAAEKKSTVVNLNSFLEGICGLMSQMTQSRGITLARDLQTDIDLSLDPAQMTSVIQNLIKNSVEAMKDGCITVSSRLAAEAVELSVEDNGPGIPEEIMGSLFKPFASFGKTKGTGLGLAGAKSVVTNHGGTIAVENSPTGARFTIRLPR